MNGQEAAEPSGGCSPCGPPDVSTLDATLDAPISDSNLVGRRASGDPSRVMGERANGDPDMGERGVVVRPSEPIESRESVCQVQEGQKECWTF